MEEDHHSRPATARTRELGQELRLARRRANLTATAVAEELGWSQGKLSKLEHGWRSTSDWDYGTLLGKLGVDSQTRQRIHRIAAEPDIGHFIRTFDDRLPDSLLCLSIHERTAITLCAYEPMLIHGLLQTEAYARAVINPHGTFAAGDHDLLVTARMRRQEVLSGSKSPEATFYIHEAALRTRIGSDKVMHDQMMQLAFMCGWTRLSPRVIPQSAEGHPALAHPFCLMTFRKPVKPVAQCDTDVATLFTEEEKSIEIYQRKDRILASRALDAEQSRLVFAHWANIYDRREDRNDQGPDLA